MVRQLSFSPPTSFQELRVLRQPKRQTVFHLLLGLLQLPQHQPVLGLALPGLRVGGVGLGRQLAVPLSLGLGLGLVT